MRDLLRSVNALRQSRAGSISLAKLLLAMVTALLGILGIARAPGLVSAGASLNSLAVLPPGSDTTFHYGWVQDSASPSGQVHVDQITIPVALGQEYWIQIMNGAPGGTNRVDSLKGIWNGKNIIGASDFNSLTDERERVIAATQIDTLKLTIFGAETSYVRVAIFSVPDPTFTFFGPNTLTKSGSGTQTNTATFTLPTDAFLRHYLYVINGDSVGARRVTSAEIKINGTTVIASTDVTTAIGSIVKFANLGIHAGTDTIQAILTGPTNSLIRIRIAASDSTAPVVTMTAPADSAVTSLTSLPVTGTLSDRTALKVTVNGATATVTGDSSFSGTATLATDGWHTITTVVTDVPGLSTTKIRSVRRDATAPTLTVATPAESTYTQSASVTVSGSASDASTFSVNVNGTPFTVTSGSFSGSFGLTYGSNTLLTTATDQANNQTAIARLVVRDTLKPTLAVSAPTNGTSTGLDSITVSGSASDANPFTLTVNGIATTVTSGSFSRKIALAFGSNTITTVATDRAGNATTDTRTVTRDLPPEPTAVAPALNASTQTTVHNSTQFLYTGTNPIQTGVAAGTIRQDRASILRGKIIDQNGDSLSGVVVTVAGRSEFGQTLTRLSGRYDLAVNGGGELTLNFAKSGYLSAQRQVVPGWNGWTELDNVALIPLTTRKTNVIIGGGAIQIAKGDSVQDTAGVRQALIMFPANTQMTATLAGGSTVVLSDSVKVRVTEYTVGARGPAQMPAALPPSSGYTYAAEITVDEAEAAGAVGVLLNQPVPVYVDNFLGIPAGYDIPVGVYDRQLKKWVPEPDGRVIKIVSITAGKADLQIDTITNHIAAQSQLDSLGINDAERTSLASTYAAGKTLWRTRHSHFSIIDYNQYFWLDPNSRAPRANGDQVNRWRDKGSCTGGSIIGCENQTLGEVLPVTGTSYVLAYGSHRVRGYKAESFLDVQVVDDTVPAIPYIKRASARLTVAGKKIFRSYGLVAGLRDSISWDGTDAYGRAVQGQQPALVERCYVYDPPMISGVGGGTTFGSTYRTGLGIEVLRPFSTPEICASTQLTMGAWSVAGQGLGGWTLSPAHAYDPVTQTLHLGTGERRSAAAIGNIITNFAGSGVQGRSADGTPAKSAKLNVPRGLAFSPNGNVFISSGGQPRVDWVDTAGILRTFAGDSTGTLCPAGQATACGDGQAATSLGVKFRLPYGLAMGADGSLFISDYNDFRIRKVNPAGIISTVAGTGVSDTTGLFGPATAAAIGAVPSIAVGPDGSLYLLDVSHSRVRRITPSGQMVPFAGGGNKIVSGFPATQLNLLQPTALAVAADGSVFIAEKGNVHRRVWKITPNGIATRVAGTGTVCSAGFYQLCGDNGPGTSALLGDVEGLAVAQDGSLYLLDAALFRIRRVDPKGIITTVVGTGERACNGNETSGCRENDGDGATALQAALHGPFGIAFGPDNALYIADGADMEVRRIAPAMPGIVPTDMLIASEDGSAAYLFDNAGRHKFTLDALTRDTLLRIVSDTAGRIDSLIDTDGNVTRVQRNGSGQPTAIIAPFGQVTTLTTDTAGYLASVANPGGEKVRLWSKPTGLLDSLADPRGKVHKFQYDNLGRLRRDDDPAGGYKTLAISSKTDSTEVVQIATAMGRTTSYITTDRPNGDVERRITDPANLEMKTTITKGGTTTTVLPDSTSVTLQTTGDPRFGMQASILSSLITRLPSGLADTVLAWRHDSLSNSNDPLSLVSQTDSVKRAGNKSVSTYTAATRRLVQTSAEGRQLFSTFDPQGRVVAAQMVGLDSVRFVYDSRGRLDSVIEGGRKTKYSYSGSSGRLSSVTDPLGRSTQFSYDSAGRVKVQTLPDGRVIGFSYDSAGNLTSLTPPGRPAHGFQYTNADLASQYDPPLLSGQAKPTKYFYNLDRQVDSIVRPDSLKIGFSYDGAGRPSAVSFDRGTLAFGYSPTSGSLTSIAAPGGDSLKFTYDGAMPKSVTWKGQVNGSVAVSYDNTFRVTSQTVNGASAVSFSYDKDGLLKQAGALGLRRSATNGLLLADSLNAIKTGYGYSSRGELLGMHAARGGTSLLGTGYVRDSLGRIMQLFDTTLGTPKRWSFVYDSVGRLKADSVDGSLFHAFTFDSNGNRLSYVASGGTVSYVYDSQDRLTSSTGLGGTTTYTYGSNGDLKTKTVPGGATTSYSYDALGNLVRVLVPNGAAVDTIEYLIDGQNRRVGRKLNGAITHRWLYQNQLDPVAELDSAGTVVSRFIYGTRGNVPDYMVRGGSVYRVVSDFLGSVRLVVDTATGTVAQRLDYDEWGNLILNTNPGFQPLGFAGGIMDASTGLVRFGARDYEPAIGRWTSKDPLGFDGAATGLYTYAFNDPVNYLDASGQVPVLVAVWFVVKWGAVALTAYTLYDAWDRFSENNRATSGASANVDEALAGDSLEAQVEAIGEWRQAFAASARSGGQVAAKVNQSIWARVQNFCRLAPVPSPRALPPAPQIPDRGWPRSPFPTAPRLDP